MQCQRPEEESKLKRQTRTSHNEFSEIVRKIKFEKVHQNYTIKTTNYSFLGRGGCKTIHGFNNRNHNKQKLEGENQQCIQHFLVT